MSGPACVRHTKEPTRLNDVISFSQRLAPVPVGWLLRLGHSRETGNDEPFSEFFSPPYPSAPASVNSKRTRHIWRLCSFKIQYYTHVYVYVCVCVIWSKWLVFFCLFFQTSNGPPHAAVVQNVRTTIRVLDNYNNPNSKDMADGAVYVERNGG